MTVTTVRRRLGACVSIILKVLSAVVRVALDHPLTIEHLDASAGALWPDVAEEDRPPRWPLPSA